MANKHEKAPGSRQGFRWYLTVLAQNFPDWVGLNFVFLLTCLPIFTLGPALSAMGYVMEQLAKDAPVKLLRAYCSTFRSRFLSKMAWGLLFLSLNILLATAVWYYLDLGGIFTALSGLGFAGLILLWGMGLHLFPALTWPAAPADALRSAWLDFLTDLPASILAVVIALGLIAAQLLLFPAAVPLTLTVGAVLPGLALAFPLRDKNSPFQD